VTGKGRDSYTLSMMDTSSSQSSNHAPGGSSRSWAEQVEAESKVFNSQGDRMG